MSHPISPSPPLSPSSSRSSLVSSEPHDLPSSCRPHLPPLLLHQLPTPHHTPHDLRPKSRSLCAAAHARPSLGFGWPSNGDGGDGRVTPEEDDGEERRGREMVRRAFSMKAPVQRGGRVVEEEVKEENEDDGEDEPFSPAMAFLSAFSARKPSSPTSTLTSPPPPEPDEEGAVVASHYLLGSVHTAGAFTLIRHAKHLPTSTPLIARVIRHPPTSPPGPSALTLREVRLWTPLAHPSILPLLHTTTTPQSTIMFTPYCPAGTLLAHLKRFHPLGMSVRRARGVFAQLAEGVRYLHEDARLAHRDLKLENVLLDSSGRWVLADFGLAESLDEPPSPGRAQRPPPGSLPYAAPELLRPPPQHLSLPSYADALARSDIWALGCILHALLSGALPFADPFAPRLQMKIIAGTWTMPPLREESRSRSRSRSAAPRQGAGERVLRACMEVNVDRRWTARMVCDDEWVAAGWAAFYPPPPSPFPSAEHPAHLRPQSHSHHRHSARASSHSRSRSRSRPHSHATPVSSNTPDIFPPSPALSRPPPNPAARLAAHPEEDDNDLDLPERGRRLVAELALTPKTTPAQTPSPSRERERGRRSRSRSQGRPRIPLGRRES